jgi:hypothetical protein
VAARRASAATQWRGRRNEGGRKMEEGTGSGIPKCSNEVFMGQTGVKTFSDHEHVSVSCCLCS